MRRVHGIDMSKMGQFVAFRAIIALLKENGKENVLQEAYQNCLNAKEEGKLRERNFVQDIYKEFSAEQISEKITEIVTPLDSKAEIKVIYQTIENLHQACPNDKGDWYFTGDFPTPGGIQVVNQSFINYMEGNSTRAY